MDRAKKWIKTVLNVIGTSLAILGTVDIPDQLRKVAGFFETNDLSGNTGRWILLVSGVLLLIAVNAWPKIVEPKPARQLLTIHSAVWGSERNYRHVEKYLAKRATPDRLSVMALNESFGGLQNDPAHGESKWLTVEYSYDGGAVRTARRPEGIELVLPEDTWLLNQIQKATTKQSLLSGGEIAKVPSRVTRITGDYFDVRIDRYGVVSETRSKHVWMMCAFTIRARLRIDSDNPIRIADVKMRTHQNRPPCTSFPFLISLAGTELTKSSPELEMLPQIMYWYDEGGDSPPANLELVIVDELGAEHPIGLRDGEPWPKFRKGPIAS